MDDKGYIISYCGIRCDQCEYYKNDEHCHGCRKQGNPFMECQIRACCIEMKLKFCGCCRWFPCHKLDRVYKQPTSQAREALQLMKSMDDDC